MTATKTSKPAKDGTSTAFTLEMAAEWVSGNTANATHLAEPAGETLITPAQEGTDATGITQLSGGVGIRGWLSGIFSRLSSALAVTQFGTWTVQPGNTVNTTPWKVDGSSVTQPASAASLPLPSGAMQQTGGSVAISGTLPAFAATPPVAPAISGDIIIVPSANFTRPANTAAYAAGQLVGNSTTAGSVVPLSWVVARVNAGNLYVRRATMLSTGKSITNAAFVLYLYTVSPTIASGDGAAFRVRPETS